jgi:hypothetical protein
VRLIPEGKQFAGMVLRKDGSKIVLRGPNEEVLWNQLLKEASKGSPDYFGYDGAKERFLHFFPGGFQSRDFEEKEGEYKRDAKARLDAALPVEQAAAGEVSAKAIEAALTTLLHPRFEIPRLKDVLRGPRADAFVQSAARFALDPGPSTLAHVKLALEPNDCAKWVFVTYLPFLWLPERHMFLRPEVTMDYASRVGHPFAHDYSGALDADVYFSLLDLANETEREIANLRPRDRIDIQSFIWVVGSYEKGKHSPKE